MSEKITAADVQAYRKAHGCSMQEAMARLKSIRKNSIRHRLLERCKTAETVEDLRKIIVSIICELT